MSIEGKHSYRFVYLKSDKWQSVRLDALAREKGKCQICFLESISNDAHHIWYPESVWDTTADHLVILCRSCHDFIHTMVPECKTKDEEEGREHWKKFRNSIILWRQSHQLLFQSKEGAELLTPKSLRDAYETLKVKYDESVNNPDKIEKKSISKLVEKIQKAIAPYIKDESPSPAALPTSVTLP